MQFQSKFGAYQVLVRPQKEEYNSDRSVVIDIRPRLVAEFGKWGEEYTYENHLTGSMDRGADMRGFFFDSEIAQEENGWSDEERELVEKVLVRQCNMTPDHVWIYQEAKIPAPWATYDEMHHEKIPAFAEAGGFTEAALAYEKQNKNRAGVVQKLETALAKDAVEEELTAA